MMTWGHDPAPRQLPLWRHSTAARVLPVACAALVLATMVIAVPGRAGGQPSVFALGVPAVAALLFALPSRRGLLALLGIGLAVALVCGALYAARAIGAL